MFFLVIGTYITAKQGYAMAKRHNRNQFLYGLLVGMLFVVSFYVFSYLTVLVGVFTKVELIVGLAGGSFVCYLFLLYLDKVFQKNGDGSQDILDDVIL